MGLSELKFLAVEDHEFQRGMLLKMLARLAPHRYQRLPMAAQRWT